LAIKTHHQIKLFPDIPESSTQNFTYEKQRQSTEQVESKVVAPVAAFNLSFFGILPK